MYICMYIIRIYVVIFVPSQASNPNKTSEPELDILIMLLECMVLLCQRRGVREELRKRRVYCVVRNLDVHLGEQHERVTELIYDIVNFLIGDEDHATAVDRYEDSAASSMHRSAAVDGATTVL